MGDASHVMLLTSGSGQANDIDGVSMLDASGNVSLGPSLPALEHAVLVPTADGYAIGGAHCMARSTKGVEQGCTTWVPTVVFIAPDGATEATVSGAEQDNAIFSSVFAGGDEVLFQIDATHWAAVTKSGGFAKLALPAGHTQACRVRSGELVAATVTSASTNLQEADDSPASVQFWIRRKGDWVKLGDAIPYANASVSTSPVVACVPGGFITSSGILDSAKGLRRVASLPPSTAIAQSAAGIDLLGRAYFSPIGKVSSPTVVGGAAPTLKIADSDRWIAVSSDGTHVASGGPNGSELVPAR